MNEKLEKTLESVSSAQKEWAELFATISRTEIQLTNGHAALDGSSLDELSQRLETTFVLAESLRNIEDGAAILICPRLPAIEGPLTQIRQQTEAAKAYFSKHPDGNFSNPSGNLTIQTSQNGSVVENWNLSIHLEPIAKQQMVLLDQLTLALRFRRYKGIGLFQERARELREMSQELESMLADGKSAIAGIQEILQSAQKTNEYFSNIREDADKGKSQISSLVPEAQKSFNEIESKLAHIKEITQSANSLSTQVDEYQASFTAFQESLDSRVQAHDKFVADMKAAQESSRERDEMIESLISKADTMIKGATTAGLSLSLDQAKDSYERRLKRTGWWFLGSVIVLLICSIPIAGQFIPGPWQESLKVTGAEPAEMWLSTLGKFIWLLPATWATAFFARNYSELFHLHREYAHKAAMAKAIDGFKREAPEYKEEIVAGVFMEIRDNPGSRQAPSPATPENPITKNFFTKVLEAIQKKKGG